MKVLAINGSPRKEGNTYHALKLVENGKDNVKAPDIPNKVFTHFIR